MINSNYNYLGIIFCLLFLVSSCTETKPSFLSTFTVSTDTTHKIPNGQQYTFGYLRVLENRNKPQGNTIQLPVYIFKSRNPNPKKDPIIYTVGGPGASTMPSAQYMKYYQYLNDRDFILIEQRGTQYAKPHLDCPEWAKAAHISNLPNFDDNQYDQLFEAAASACKKRLEKDNIDLNQYTTNAIAADIADLKKALNIDTYNLLTISYSTKIAQVLLRDYPEDIRSVVMDSPLPLEVNYDEESITNLMNSVQKLLSACKSDDVCNTAYPNLEERFLSYLKDKTQNPLKVIVQNPKTNMDETFLLTGSDLITIFKASTLENVPFEINKLLHNDLSSLKIQLRSLFEESGIGMAIGMRLSVWCAEENPFNSEENIKAESKEYAELKGLSPAVFSKEVCDIWSVKKVSKIENEAVKSDIPVLIISGEYDTETPVKWATAMKQNLPNSKHIIFKGWRHGTTTNWSNQCAMEVANAFFNNPIENVIPDCFSEIKNLEFKTND
ncbi:alpha/beta fold hydrolase [Kordia jejudonensis]|uniref:alpha/beta fold hydrolase n=1 Tax=Kordia jejudonensis TaxID=1348245 RepID=UPI0006293797|nr:alpha/beta fold hydrolase [Kordia jejudonensis]